LLNIWMVPRLRGDDKRNIMNDKGT